jgi:hypothetical protein
VGRHEDPPHLLRDLLYAVQGAQASDLLHQLVAVEAALPRHPLELRVDEGQVPIPHYVAEGDGKQRLDP